jgi:AAA+ ATPase superfamily predicted ATPase
LASTGSSIKKKRVSKEGNKKCIEMIEVHQEKCTKLLVQNVEKKLKFLLNRMVLDRFIAGTVIRSVNQKDFSKNS